MTNTSDAVIAVISGAYPNTLEKTLEVVRAVSAGQGPVPGEWAPFLPGLGSFTIVGNPEHRAVQSQFPTASWVFVNSRNEAPGTVAQLLQQFVGRGKRVLLLGFQGEILGLAKAVWPGIQVRPKHFFDSDRQTSDTSYFPRALPISGREPAWTFNHVSRVQQALDTLAQVLEQKGAVGVDRAVRQTKLRPLMAQVNPTQFFGNAASTNSSGMIATLLQIAAVRGLVSLAGEPGDYLVWLRRDSVSFNDSPEQNAARRAEAATAVCSQPAAPLLLSIPVSS